VTEVSDSGHRMPSLTKGEPDATSGRGLHLVETVTDAWGVREELPGKTVWARIDLER
jgi:serine/threonine-protein kinase RsbW